MIPPIKFKGEPRIPENAWHLLYDPRDSDWSLWHGGHTHDRFVITWQGGKPDGSLDEPDQYTKEWPDNRRFAHYRLTQEQADQCVMAAMALTPEGWYRFAKRLVEGDTSC